MLLYLASGRLAYVSIFCVRAGSIYILHQLSRRIAYALYLASGRLAYASIFCFGRVPYYTPSGVRPDSSMICEIHIVCISIHENPNCDRPVIT